MNFYNKYIKYKQKYLKLKNHQGGKLPFVKLDNGTNDYFPFDNNNFNYYNDDDFPEILINTIKLKDENDKKVDYLFDYLVNKDIKHTIKLFKNIDKKHYTKLRNFIENYPNYNDLLTKDPWNYKI